MLNLKGLLKELPLIKEPFEAVDEVKKDAKKAAKKITWLVAGFILFASVSMLVVLFN